MTPHDLDDLPMVGPEDEYSVDPARECVVEEVPVPTTDVSEDCHTPERIADRRPFGGLFDG